MVMYAGVDTIPGNSRSSIYGYGGSKPPPYRIHRQYQSSCLTHRELGKPIGNSLFRTESLLREKPLYNYREVVFS